MPMNRRKFLAMTGGASLPAGMSISQKPKRRAKLSYANPQNPPEPKQHSQPNIVWIWSDNLAYRDLGIYGNSRIQTPHIDRLAETGVRFNQYYIAHTVCSPSRAAFLTGRQPFRVGIVDVLRPDSPSGIPQDEITIAEALKELGYATACIGKWHLGDRKPYLPLQHGFDRYFGLPYSMDMLPTLLYKDNQIFDRLEGDKVQDVTEKLVDESLEFIKDSQHQPFFLYLSHTLPHPPINIPPQYRTEDHSLYEEAIQYMDDQTSRIIDLLDQLGLRENTLVIFSSDNGPMLRDGDTGGLRGRIRDSYEGGIRVPLIANWPGTLPEGEVVDTPAIAYDFFPTFLKLAGGKLPEDRIYDGQDIWPLLSKKGSFQRRKPLVWVYRDNVTSIRDGKWKLHLAEREEKLKEPELYDLDRDPQESEPVNEQHPDVVERLTEQVKEFETQLPKVWSLQYPVRDQQKRPSGVRRQ